MSKEEFKKFVSTKPELADYVKDNIMTWQKFYELYDLYGENNQIWEKYSTPKETNKINDFIKKINPDTLQQHIQTAQKALDIFSELAIKKEPTPEIIPEVQRPITKFFGD